MSDELKRLLIEVERQDGLSTYGAAGRDDVRIALACMQDELDETLEAFQAEKRPKEGRTWARTRSELVQAVAVGYRLLRDLESADPTRGGGSATNGAPSTDTQRPRCGKKSFDSPPAFFWGGALGPVDPPAPSEGAPGGPQAPRFPPAAVWPLGDPATPAGRQGRIDAPTRPEEAPLPAPILTYAEACGASESRGLQPLNAPAPEASSCRGALELMADLINASTATSGQKVTLLSAIVTLESALELQEAELIRLDELAQRLAERPRLDELAQRIAAAGPREA